MLDDVALGKQLLWGEPVRASQPWTIYSAPVTANTLTRVVEIKTAWF
jgi:hypothetical protein